MQKMKFSQNRTTLENFYRGLFKDVNFEPSYQRDFNAWPEKNKAGLIESVLQGMSLPKFYLFQDQNNLNKYEVIDGKQRLSTLLEFTFGVKFPSTKKKLFPINVNNTECYYRDLSDEDKAILKGVNLDFEILTGDKRDAILTFINLQRGMKLTPLDIRHAIGGDLCEHIIEFIKNNKIPKILGNNSMGKRKWEGDLTVFYKIISDFYHLPPPEKNSFLYNRHRFSHIDSALDELYTHYTINRINKQVWNKFNWLFKVLIKGTSSIKEKGNTPVLKGVWYTILKLEELYDLNNETWEHIFNIIYDEGKITLDDYNNDPNDLNYYSKLKLIFGYDPRRETINSSWIVDFEKGSETFYNYFEKFLLQKNKIKNKKHLTDLYSDDKIKQQIIDKNGLKCIGCGINLQLGSETYDHIVARANGGLSTVSNGQIMCQSCNSKKGASK